MKTAGVRCSTVRLGKVIGVRIVRVVKLYWVLVCMFDAKYYVVGIMKWSRVRRFFFLPAAVISLEVHLSIYQTFPLEQLGSESTSPRPARRAAGRDKKQASPKEIRQSATSSLANIRLRLLIATDWRDSQPRPHIGQNVAFEPTSPT